MSIAVINGQDLVTTTGTAVQSSTLGAANGVATLNGTSKVVQHSSWEGVANGIAQLDGSVKVPVGQLTGVLASTDLTNDAALEKTANKGAASGYASLDGSTLIPLAQGGTRQSTWATGDLLYASATNTLSKLTIGSTNNVLTVIGGVPSWQPVSASSLQSAYGAGNTIATTAGSGITFSNAADATDLLTLSRTFAGGGTALKITMGASATGNAISVSNANGSSSDTVFISQTAGSASALQVTQGVSSTGVGISVTQAGTGQGAAISHTGSSNSNVLTLTKSPSGAQSGSALSISMGANTTGDSIAVTQNGTGRGLNITGTTSQTLQGLLISYSGSSRPITTLATGTLPSAVLFSSTATNSNSTVEIDRQPTSSSSGSGLSVIMNANATDPGIVVTASAGTSGSGAGVTVNVTGSSTGSGFRAVMSGATSAHGMEILQNATGGGSGIYMSAGSGETGITFANNTVTVNSPIISAGQTWNAGGVTFKGILVDITNTASAAASKIFDLQIASATAFNVSIDGSVSCPGAGSSSERFGGGATAAGNGGLSVGRSSSASGTSSTAVGNGASATGASGGSNDSAFGYGAVVNGGSGGANTALGATSSLNNANCVGSTVVGYGASGIDANQVAVGAFANCGAFTGSIAIGRTAANTANNQLIFGSASVAPITQAIFNTGANGQTSEVSMLSENLVLSTSGTTTDTTMQLPAGAIILAVTARVTTTITTATDWSVGDPTTAARFISAQTTLTSGFTKVGLNQMQGSVSTDAAGPVQTTAASVRVTTTGTPGAGAIRLTIHYYMPVAPTS